MRLASEERGSFSLLGLSILGILSLLGAAAFAITQQHFSTSRRFAEAFSLRLEAWNGIVAAGDRIRQDDALTESVPEGYSSLSILSYRGWEDATASGEVYAKRQGDRILLLATGRKGAVSGQVLAHMKKRDGRWRLSGWKH